jgi:hypothetical protein
MEIAGREAPKICEGGDCKPEEVAAYVCEMTRDFKKLAESADLAFLAYLIDMVHIEAFGIACAAKNAKQKARD